MQTWSKAVPIKQRTQEYIETAWKRVNQFTDDPNGPNPFEAPTRPAGRDISPSADGTELVRTEWFTSLVNGGVRACATFQVDAGPIHFDTPKVCVTAADLAGAFTWLIGGLVGEAAAHNVPVNGLTKAGIDGLTAALAVHRASSLIPD